MPSLLEGHTCTPKYKPSSLWLPGATPLWSLKVEMIKCSLLSLVSGCITPSGWLPGGHPPICKQCLHKILFGGPVRGHLFLPDPEQDSGEVGCAWSLFPRRRGEDRVNRESEQVHAEMLHYKVWMHGLPWRFSG